MNKKESEFQPLFIQRMIATLSWPGLVSAAKDVCFLLFIIMLYLSLVYWLLLLFLLLFFVFNYMK